MKFHLRVPEDPDDGDCASARVALFFLSDRSEVAVSRVGYHRKYHTKELGSPVLFAGFAEKKRQVRSSFSLCVFVRPNNVAAFGYVLALSDTTDEELGCVRWLLEEWGVDHGEEAAKVFRDLAQQHERDLLERFSAEDRFRKVSPFEGTSFVEGVELYRSTGELVPVFWPDDAFVAWVEDAERA